MKLLITIALSVALGALVTSCIAERTLRPEFDCPYYDCGE